jgi:SWI/SNF-related matrix-associated actin-dependent regulator 1 of chromatin subfamily A
MYKHRYLIDLIMCILITGSMDKGSPGIGPGSLNLLSNLRKFRYAARPVPKLNINDSPSSDSTSPVTKVTQDSKTLTKDASQVSNTPVSTNVTTASTDVTTASTDVTAASTNVTTETTQNKPIVSVSGGTQTENTSFLKLNTQIFKRLHEKLQDDGSHSPPKKACNGEALLKQQKNEESLKHLKKLFSAIDEMEVQDALIRCNWNINNAVMKLNEMIKGKINPIPKPKPTSPTTSTLATASNAGNKIWKRIKIDPALANSAITSISKPAVKTVVQKPSSSSPSKNKGSVTNTSVEYYNPRSKKQSVMDFLSNAPYAELITVPSLSAKKADIILKVRPFTDWSAFCKKIEKEGVLAVDSLYDNVSEVLRVRSEVSSLMRTCIELSQRLASKLKQLTLPGNPVSLAEQPASLTQGLKLAGYQMIGLSWLRLLHDQGVNGILADEMGLGKTIQVIAFLAYLKEQNLKEGVHIIVVPSSTLENWSNELSKWCSSLHVESYYGSQEERRSFRAWWRDERNKEDVKAVDILLTTYNLVNSTKDDKGFFRKLSVQYIVYDEAHMLKNMATQRYGSLMKIDAKHRILLTGTPLQNNLIELMSLLIFVMPEIFADKQNDLKVLFKTTKANTDEQCSFEKEKIDQAKKIMEPFVLRRLKKDVLGDLPPKTDVNVYCELTTSQSECYTELLREFQNAEDADVPEEDTVEDDASKDEASTKDEGSTKDEKDEPGEGLTGSMAMMMLLRRAANHSALIRRHFSDSTIKTMAKKLKRDRSYREDNLENIEITLHNMSDHQLHTLCKSYDCIKNYKLEEDFIFDSGKIKKMDELLPKLQSEKHRVLLFSQFRQVIDLVEDYLEARGYKFCRLDGTTPVSERQSLIDDFNSDESIFIFLLTTKAGGCGINLASADTVILHDIDLNPYNDKQAEDRCHRVGQQRPVTIMRLISKGTIEEAMLKIAHNKLALEKQITHGVSSKQTDKKLLSLLKEALKVQ